MYAVSLGAFKKIERLKIVNIWFQKLSFVSQMIFLFSVVLVSIVHYTEHSRTQPHRYTQLHQVISFLKKTKRHKTFPAAVSRKQIDEEQWAT